MNKKAFSLAELMIVMLVLTIILAATMPILSKRAKVKSAAAAVTTSVPVGTIVAYGGATAPTGWLLCDGSSLLRTGTYASLFTALSISGTPIYGSVDATHFNVPDLRGIFIRGAGTSTTHSNANGTAFSGTLGAYQNDKMQGHYHTFGVSSYYIDDVQLMVVGGGAYKGFTVRLGSSSSVTNPISDGANGNPRYGTETNPANLSLNYIIKY